MTVDFHCHSTASDGTLSPTELAEAGASLAMMAITDHDNANGVAEFLASRSSCRRIAGLELSIEPGEGFHKFHLLGLGIDPENAVLKTFLRRILDGRNARNERIVENFRRLGIEMVDLPSVPSQASKQSDVEADCSSDNQTIKQSNNQTIFSYSHGEVLARPHFAHWLMDHGYEKSVAEAFDRYLTPDSPAGTRCYEERWHPSQEEAFRVIHDAGGLCIMAHPKYWRNEWKVTGCDFAMAERGLAELKEKGLDGVEAIYQSNTEEENVEFVLLATKFGYLKSAGSDFHGATKPAISLGMAVSDDYIQPLIERLS